MTDENNCKKVIKISRTEFEEGINKIKWNIINFLDSADVLKSNKVDHASILTQFTIEELD